MCVWMKERQRDTRWMEKGERVRERVWWVLAHGPAHGTSSVFVCVLFVSEGFMPLPGRQGCCRNRITHAAQGGKTRERRGEERRGEEEKQEQPRENHREKLDCGKSCTFSFHLHNLLSPPSPPFIWPAISTCWSGKNKQPSNPSVFVFTQMQWRYSFLKLTIF